MLALTLCILAATPAAPPAPASAVTAIAAPTALEQKLINDARDGTLDSMGLLEAALVASGVPDAEVPAEAVRARAALAPAIGKASTQRDPHKRGDTLLRALHATVFRTYAMQASEVDDVIRTGQYNCLSSALLFVVAAEGLLPNAKGMVTKHHAFARVSVNGKMVDVETTTPAGFDADRKKLMTPEYVKKIAGAETSPQALLDDLEHPEELPVLSLVAGVYSNRAVALVQRGDLAGAAAALDRASRLASGNLRARSAAWRGGVLNNGAITLVEQDRLDDARALLLLAREGTEGTTRALLQQNLGTVELKLAERALAQSDWTGALAHVAEARTAGVAEADAAQVQARADAALATLEGSDARCVHMLGSEDKAPPAAAAKGAAECFAGLAFGVKDTDPARALQYARRAFFLAPTGPNSERSLFASLMTSMKSATARLACGDVEVLAREADAHAASVFAGMAAEAKRGAAAAPPSRWSAAQTVGACWANAGDKAFDKKDWAEAGRLYDRALIFLPAEESLKKNLASVDLNDAIGLAQAGQCDPARARAHRALHADPTLADKAAQLLEGCAGVRAERAAKASDWAGAVTELRRGLVDVPKSPMLTANLGTMLHNLAAGLLKAHDCEGARALLPELERLHKDAATDAVKKSCP